MPLARARRLASALATLIVLFIAASDSRAQEFVAGRVVVKLDAAVADDVPARLTGARTFRSTAPDTALDSLVRTLGVTGARRLVPSGARGRAGGGSHRLDLANLYVFELAAEQDVRRAAAELSKDPRVVYAHPDHVGHALLTTNDPRLSCALPTCAPEDYQWALHKIHALEAWDATRGAGVVVAVVDSGLNATHVDLAGNVWTNPGEVADGTDNDDNGFIDDTWGWDFVVCNTIGAGGECVDPAPPGGDDDPSDEDSHGTAVGGVVAAVGNNATLLVGVAHQAKVMAVRALNAGLRTTESAVIPAIVYAADNGADVIQMAFASAPTEAFHDAIAYAAALDVVLIAAAGNSGNTQVFYPAGFDEVIAVGSTDIDDLRSSFSTFNADLELTAPGERINALGGIEPGSSEIFTSLSGTSLSSPHASGLAALVRSRQPALSSSEVRSALCAGAVDLGAPGRDPSFGCGRIDAARTLREVCGPNVCGDGVDEPACGEACDDGNTTDGDCCSADCRARALGAPCTILTKGVATCQATLGTYAQKYAQVRHAELARCFGRLLKDLAAGKGTVRGAEACRKRLAPTSPSSSIARARQKLVDQTNGRCEGVSAGDLGTPCDPNATTLAEIVSCVVQRYDRQVDEMAAAAYADACALIRAVGLESAFPRLCAA